MGNLGARPPSPVDIMDMIPDPEEAGAGEGNEEENIFRDMTFDEILEDLNARFLVNLPREETSLVRVYWQAEQALVGHRKTCEPHS
jgi:mRNA-decapping enzyme subunit 2